MTDPICHCGMDGHALKSVNCPVHGYECIPKCTGDSVQSDEIEILRNFRKAVFANWANGAHHPRAEPICWRYQRTEGWDGIWRYSTRRITEADFETPAHWIVEPLYAAPQPLSVAQRPAEPTAWAIMHVNCSGVWKLTEDKDSAEYWEKSGFPVQALYAFPSTHSRCAKCHCETKGEAALVDGKIWCHPCADSLTSTSLCTCAAIVNPNIPHARTCPLSSTVSNTPEGR